jgi:glycerol-3-phosphate dehydrogenase (NAD(P)+)
MANIAIIGAGAWGSALALALSRRERHAVTLWAYEKEAAEAIREHGENSLFLAGFPLPRTITATNSLMEAIEGAEFVISVMPSHHVRRLWTQLKPQLRPETLLVSATKGVENGSLLRMTEVISDVVSCGDGGFSPRLAAISGPSFAREVAAGFPTTLTVASADPELSALVQEAFSTEDFRLYRSDDLIGLELGGAVKNVIAIAAGVVDGMGYGHNTAAALITRGLAEMTRLAIACGGRAETMAGLSGLGDLVLTCTGGLSRNRSVGVELGRGRRLDEIISAMHGQVAEGVMTTRATLGLAHKVGVEMPITEQMSEILDHGKDPSEAIRELMCRPLVGESVHVRQL